MDALAMLWANARAAHLLAIRRMTPVEVGSDWDEGCKTDQDSPLMYTQKVEILEPFSSHVIPMKMMEAYLGERLNMMVQALHTQDSTLPPGITMQNTYTELRKGSKKAVVVVRNNTAYPQTLWKKTLWQGQWLCNRYPISPNLGVYKFKMKCVLIPKPRS